MPLFITKRRTPIGELKAWRNASGLVALEFADGADRPGRGFQPSEPELGDPNPAVGEALDRYFAGDVDALDDLPVNPHGTELQQRIWEALRDVPAGQTRAYADLAREVGTSPRVVGNAMARNPVCLALPCHRVVRTDGSWEGYAYGGNRKRWLLDHEARHRNKAK